MKIAVLQSFLPSRSQGGVGHFTHQLANRLADRGHTITVYSSDPPPTDAAYRVVQPDPGTWFLRVRLGRVFGFGLWLARQDYSQFDVVHAMGDNHLIRTRTPVLRTISGSALAEALHARKPGARLMYLAIYPLELLGVARANLAVGISQCSNAHFPGVRMVIPQGIDLPLFAGSAGGATGKSERPAVLFVGHRLRDRKRGYLLVQAFQGVIRPALPDAELWLVCDDAVAAPGVRCFANLDQESLAELYRRAWVFCLPSSYEGFGRPYAEAMAAGTAVVATPNPGAMEVLDGGRYGVLASAAGLGETILALLKSTDRRERMAQAGSLRAQAFDWHRVVPQYEALYRRLAGPDLGQGGDAS